MSQRRKVWTLVAIAAVLAHSRIAMGQVISGDLVSANSDDERYLRVLQDRGLVPLYPWSVREFGPKEIDFLLPADSTHPWASRIHASPPREIQFQVLHPAIELTENSAFPYGFNDGPLWAGKGLTADVQLGVAFRAGPLSVVAEPEFFQAENLAFPLMRNGESGRLQFADGVYPNNIDQPQRFGAGAYQQLDPGQSTIRLDIGKFAVGVSTADQFWGPAMDNPFLLGNNAAGIPNAFVGASTPWNLGLGHLAWRLEYGRMDQSAYSVDSTNTRRFMSGLVATFTPNAFPGLEIGGGRFFYTAWPDSGLRLHNFLIPYEGSSLSVTNPALVGTPGYVEWNQLASLFARWVFPNSGAEIYGELGEIDHRINLDDVALEPDHDASYMVGFQRVWRRASGDYWALRGEVLDSRITGLALSRDETTPYIGTYILQGFTEDGQVLGSAGALGGGASEVAVDRYYRGGRLTFSWNRIMRYEQLNSSGLPNALAADVMQALSVESVLFSRYGDATTELTAVRDFNRNFAGDVSNLRLRVGWRERW
jgi:hypothetical protein